ncbi:MAG: hypothetical protein ACEQSK_15415, partial [Sphingomonadaceae bacterium]
MSATQQASIYAPPHELKKFREEDKKRSREHLDTHVENKETDLGQKTVKSLNDVMELIPSHILERYKASDGKIEYNSDKFSQAELELGVLSKIDPTDSKKIIFNTHIDRRNYSQAEKDRSKQEVLKQKFVLEYQKIIERTDDENKTEKTILIASYKDFIEQVLADDTGRGIAKNFFFGKTSKLVGLNNISQFTDKVIEDNIADIHSGMAKAIGTHDEMEPVQGIGYLNRNFPAVNKLISELYFEPHGKDSPHKTDKTIPAVLVEIMNDIQNTFKVSSKAFDSQYAKYVTSERLGQYITADSRITSSTTALARVNLVDTTLSNPLSTTP